MADITERVLEITTTLSLKNAASARVVIDNADGAYDIPAGSVIGNALTLQADVDTVATTIFTGYVKGQFPKISIRYGRDVVELVCVSPLDRISMRPITTQEEDTFTAQGWLEELLINYAAFEAADMADITDLADTSLGRVIISENSMVAACEKICQAANCEFFIGPLGTVYAQDKHTTASTPSVTLQYSDLDTDIEQNFEERILPTACRVRGSYIGATENSVTFVSSTGYNVTTGEDGIGYVRVIPDIDISDDQAMTATVTVTDPAGVSGFPVGMQGQHLKIRFEGATLTPGSTTAVTFSVTGFTDLIARSINSGAHNVGVGVNESMGLWRSVGTIFGKSTYQPSPRDRQWIMHNDEAVNYRIEKVVKDASLVTLHGIRYCEVDNMYITSEALATAVGEQYLYEQQIAQRTITTGGPFNASLLIPNVVVTVPLPFSGTRKCLLTECRCAYAADTSEWRMDWEFVELV